MDNQLGVSPVYTGSGVNYNKPSLQYVLSGEGNISFGWGLYASSDKDTALWYMNRFGIGQIHVNYMIGTWNKINSELDKLRLVDRLNFIKYRDRLSKILDPNLFKSVDEFKSKLAEIVQATKVRYDEEVDNKLSNKLLFEYFDSLRSCAIVTKNEDHYNLYEQRFWCDKIPDLLDWSRSISITQMNKVRINALKENLKFNLSTEYGTFTSMSELLDHQGYLYGKNLYSLIANSFEEDKYKNASLFLLRSGIDGIRYPIGTLGTGLGKVNGWNYVSFSDYNIEVIHHWENGKLIK